MSETDDTDVLLLIPPNFFLVHSSGSEDSLLESSRTVVHKPPSCTAQVLGKLVDQVHSLEYRLNSLELDSTLSCYSQKKSSNDTLDSRSLDRKCFTFPRRRRRKLREKKDSSIKSFTSTSTHGIPELNLISKKGGKCKSTDTLINDSLSMDGDISSIVSTPSKKNDKLLLNEIDEFLIKVETYESPETKLKEHNLSPENVIKATGDYLSHKLDSKCSTEQNEKAGSVLTKYIYLTKSSSPSQTESSASKTYRNVDRNDIPSYTHSTNPQSKCDKSPSIRRLHFPENKDVQPTSTPKRLTQPGTTTSYLDSFQPSLNKIYDRASKVLENYKSQSYSHVQGSVTDSDLTTLEKRREEFKMPQMRPYNVENRENMRLAMQMDSIDTDLLSLSELWGERGEKIDLRERAENNRLEEERLKREHCEAMIQQLQKKILEQQEKLAVAIKVDRAKDVAIGKLREAWLRLTGSLDRAEERHKAALDKMIREVDNFKTVAGEAQKKTNHFETELYKALDLAHDYQEKCKRLNSEKIEIQEHTEKALTLKDEIIKNKDKEIEVLKENYETVMRLNKQSTDCAKNLEEALEKEKIEHKETETKTLELTNKLQSLIDDRSLVEQDRDILKDKVNEERARCNVLERQLCESQNQIAELIKKCDSLDNDTKTLRKHLELQKTELKNHYQRQLEEAVMGKLHEFQAQLDVAERDAESRARARETAVVDAFNKQMSRIEEQHKLEVNVLEEKQKEEIKLYRLQLAQASEKIGLLESKLESYRRRRGEIAAQLHSVMQAQWRQALRILTAHHQPGANSSLDVPDKAPGAEAGVLRLPAASLATGSGRRDRDRDFDALSDNELQQYVHLLLTKPVNFDASEPDPQDEDLKDEEPTSDRPERRDPRDRAKRSLNLSKPPWKA